MSFLRRLLRGGDGPPKEDGPPAEAPDDQPGSDAEFETAELDRDREVLREEAERLDDLQRRQLRYAGRAWRPAAQGGGRRADEDQDKEPGGG